jgi:hypothetical protein
MNKEVIDLSKSNHEEVLLLEEGKYSNFQRIMTGVQEFNESEIDAYTILKRADGKFFKLRYKYKNGEYEFNDKMEEVLPMHVVNYE